MTSPNRIDCILVRASFIKREKPMIEIQQKHAKVTAGSCQMKPEPSHFSTISAMHAWCNTSRSDKHDKCVH